ncbi:ABC transporter ATP-binding protein [Rhodoferax sp.]|uniref:ABC transporter ATP-binding protein n=1 Tax=Rhodoferax sp. TaxID=50421 RepID=UPI0026115D1A|nr:ABC transporter ATP-binding protein [Rhodoferax sp.]MDD2926591.1 ABC transporter ATP-binding protein [Rhodoferax sp.]
MVSVTPTGHGVEIENVSHHFDIETRRVSVLEQFTLSVAPGEFVAILGPSGCGKSTLLRLVAGLEQPVGGRIEVNGTQVVSPDPSRILMFQDPTLFPWRTVRQNVTLGLEARGVLPQQQYRVDETLALVRLDGFADALPHQLSGGMAQRVALARALVNDPQLLLLDEPLGKLDALTRLKMQGELESLWRKTGFTAVLVTHDVEEALLLASRVLVLSDQPARILAEVKVDRPYPRSRDDACIMALRQELLAVLQIDALTGTVELASEGLAA